MSDFPKNPGKRPLPSSHPINMPSRLGTAAFDDFADGEVPIFKRGDFWLSYAQDGTPLGASDPQHVNITGMSRGGKGTDYIVPNLLLWQGSLVVIDPKGENAKITSRRRANGSAWAHGMARKL